jgi:hypothetical protein
MTWVCNLQAALETPLVSGYRLLPQFTPGRALLWGTILAMWGTAAVVVTAARRLDIQKVCGVLGSRGEQGKQWGRWCDTHGYFLPSTSSVTVLSW